MKRVFASSLLALGLCGPAVGVAAEEERPLKVVATLSTFADLVQAIGGEHVEVATIASPQFNPHFIEPKPSDVLKVKRADALVHAGLDLELWRGPLLDAAGNTRVFPGEPGDVDLSHGIALLEVPRGPVSRAQGDMHLYGNPHYWLDPRNALVMAKTIATRLSELDPAHASVYDARMRAWTRQLDQLIAEWQQRATALRGQEVVADHNAWPYLMAFLGMKTEQFLEPKPGIPPTPKHVEFLTRYIPEHGVRAILRSAYTPAGTAKGLAQRTGVSVVLVCQNVREQPPCADYVTLIDYNITHLLQHAAQRAPAPR